MNSGGMDSSRSILLKWNLSMNNFWLWVKYHSKVPLLFSQIWVTKGYITNYQYVRLGNYPRIFENIPSNIFLLYTNNT